MVFPEPGGPHRMREGRASVATKAGSGPEVERLFADIPFGLPTEATPGPSGPRKRGSSLRNYGLDSWVELFTPRQLLALGTFVKHTRTVRHEMIAQGYPAEWADAVTAYLASALDRLADYSSAICSSTVGDHNSRRFLNGARCLHFFQR